MCEAETEAFAEVLGTHVQRLATIANGDAACTTHVPLTRSERTAEHGPEAQALPESAPTATDPAASDRSWTGGQQTAPIPDGGESV